MIQNNLDIANTRIVSKFLPQPVCDARDNVADNEASTSPAGVIKLMPSQARFLATSASVGKDAFGQESFTEGVDPRFRGVLGLEFVAFNFRFDSSDASVVENGILKRNLR